MTNEEAIKHIKYSLIEGNYPIHRELGIEVLNLAIKALERPQGEYTEEDMKQAIKENFDLGYEMAKNKYERQKGKWIEVQKGIIVTEYKCPFCGRTVKDDTGYDVSADYPFCHCGADMRRGGVK